MLSINDSYVNLNKNLNLEKEDWEVILIKNFNPEIAKFAKVLFNNKSDNLYYDSQRRLVIYENQKINLEKLVMSHLDDYTHTTFHRTSSVECIKHLAECITKKIEESQSFSESTIKKTKKKERIDFSKKIPTKNSQKIKCEDFFEDAENNPRLANLSESAKKRKENNLKKSSQKIETAIDSVKSTSQKVSKTLGISNENISLNKKRMREENVNLRKPADVKKKRLEDKPQLNQRFIELCQTAQKHEMKEIKELIERGADVNAIITKDFTLSLLSEAILSNKKDLIELLINYADIETEGLDFSPLMASIMTDNFEIFSKLVARGADLKKHIVGSTIYDQIKSHRLSNFPRMIQFIKDNHPEMMSFFKTKHQEYVARKMVGHAWHIDWTTSLKPIGAKSVKENSEFSILGGRSSLWANLITQNLDRFVSEYPHVFKDSATILNILENVKNPYSSTDKELLVQIQKGKFTIIPFGFSGHISMMVFHERTLFICDLGGNSSKPIEIYSYDPDQLSADTIHFLRDAINHPETDHNVLMSFMPICLGLRENHFLSYLQMVCNCFIGMQVVGNCSWASLITAMFTYLITIEIKESDHSKLFETFSLEMEKREENDQAILDFNELIIIAGEKFVKFEAFLRVLSLEKLLKTAKISPYEPDYKLIEGLLQMASKSKMNFDSIQIDKINSLIKFYENDILNELVDDLTGLLSDLDLVDEDFPENLTSFNC